MTTATAVGNVQATSERRKARLLAVAGAAVASLVLWALFEFAFGVDLRAPAASASQATQDVNGGFVFVMAALASLAGWALLAILEKAKPAKARKIWTVVASIVFLLSLSGPMSGTGVSGANRLGLALMHVAVAAIVIPRFRATSASA